MKVAAKTRTTWSLVGSALFLAMLLLPSFGSVYAVSDEQQRIFDSGVYYYDVDGNSVQRTGTCYQGNTNEEVIWNFFISKGLTPPQAAGVMGNISLESGGTFSPTIQEYAHDWPDGGWGIVQWTGVRRDAIRDAVLEAGLPYTDEDLPPVEETELLEFQLDYLYEESNERRMRDDSSTSEWDGLTQVETVREAVVYWEYNFERAQTPGIEQRLAPANDILARLGSSETSSSCNFSLADGDAPLLAQSILDSPNVNSDHPDQLQNVANGTGPCPDVNDTYTVDPEILRVIATLAEDNTFTLSSLHRGCTGSEAGSGKTSNHWKGKAVDISGSRPINGATMNGFGAYSQVIQGFVNQASLLLPANCELGVPNSTYVRNTQVGACTNIFPDAPSTTGATGPHVHLATP